MTINEKYKYVVYELWNPIKNQPFYVGKGSIKRKRWLSHIHDVDTDSNRHKTNTIKKIIKEGYSLEYRFVYYTNDEETAYKKEIQLIAEYGRRDLKTGILTNMTDGGDGVRNLIITDEFRQKCSENFKGEKNGMYGKTHSSDARKRISDIRKLREVEYKHTKEHIEKLKTHNPGAIAMGNPIMRFDLNGNLIGEWHGVKAAARELSSSDCEFECYARKIRIRAKKNKWDSFLGSYWRESDDYNKNGFVFYAKPGVKRQEIHQFTLNGEFVKSWDSIKQIERELNLKYSALWKSVKNETSYNGFVWKK